MSQTVSLENGSNDNFYIMYILTQLKHFLI